MIRFSTFKWKLAFAFMMCFWYSFAQDRSVLNKNKSTQDFSFLLGEWEVERIYSPEADNQRILLGKMYCSYEANNQFVKCIYEMERPGKEDALDIVYFNYNGIYDLYENLWLSSTWPIKVLMRGELNPVEDKLAYNTEASFFIGNEIEEFVRSNWEISKSVEKRSIIRKTYIKTSNDNSLVWKFHMFEKLLMKDN